MKKHLFLIAFFMLGFTNAQIKDSIHMPFYAKFNLQQTMPEGKITSSEGKIVDFKSYIKKNRKYKNKPTVIICWLTYHAYGNKIVEEIMAKKPYEKYNMVFVNLEGAKDEDFIRKTNSSYPQFITNGMSLYDTEKIFTFGKETFSLLFFWVDEDLRLVTSTFPLNRITASEIEHVLELVDSKKIVPSSTKFFDNNLIPEDEKKATLKQVFTETGNTCNLKLSTISPEEMQYDLNFIKDESGQYFYIKTKVEENSQFRKKQIIAALQQILEQQNGTPYHHIKDFGYKFADYKIKENSITYSLVKKIKTKKYSNTSIKWALLEKIETVKELEKVDMVFTFSQPFIRISPDEDTITDFKLKIRVLYKDIENLKNLFNELSNIAKKEK